MAYGSDMVVYILRAASLDRSRANQGEGCGGGGQVGVYFYSPVFHHCVDGANFTSYFFLVCCYLL
jgi:hypothetical protein